jgi:hypothetical protein
MRKLTLFAIVAGIAVASISGAVAQEKKAPQVAKVQECNVNNYGAGIFGFECVGDKGGHKFRSALAAMHEDTSFKVKLIVGHQVTFGSTTYTVQTEY